MNNSKDQSQPPPDSDPPPIAHVTGQMRAIHRSETSPLQRTIDRIGAFIAWPGFAAVLCLLIIAWIALNLALAQWGLDPIDPPPFAWLEIVATNSALMLAILIFTTQRREDKLADRRGHLIMELSISNDLKISKIIELLEEARRDNPAIVDRIDDQALQMSNPSDPEAVLVAIKDLQD